MSTPFSTARPMPKVTTPTTMSKGTASGFSTPSNAVSPTPAAMPAPEKIFAIVEKPMNVAPASPASGTTRKTIVKIISSFSFFSSFSAFSAVSFTLCIASNASMAINVGRDSTSATSAASPTYMPVLISKMAASIAFCKFVTSMLSNTTFGFGTCQLSLSLGRFISVSANFVLMLLPVPTSSTICMFVTTVPNSIQSSGMPVAFISAWKKPARSSSLVIAEEMFQALA
ncbi:hypothetical protein EJ06DRAFT_254943 [Trichodelitschia bisporula]|uniref:Uncharacterized protein n=1 Tax=Trichodelitschia bisporula TaxID=703511 RepID=A0A6G1HJN2_9PEZI|nr:hypothetical protein EJ06DRAFT_254943 [Trichodelitschia bisporula]